MSLRKTLAKFCVLKSVRDKANASEESEKKKREKEET